MIDRSPQVMTFPVDFHENLVEMPAPSARAHALDAPLADLPGEHRSEPISPEAHRFVADIDVAMVEQIFYIPQR